MGETRARLVTVLCKVFLRYFDKLARIPGVPVEASGQDGDSEKSRAPRRQTEFVLVRAWMGTLELLERLMNASVGNREGEALEEAVMEGVKNVLLVLGDDGYMRRPEPGAKSDEVTTQLWEETDKRLGKFLPGLMVEIFPPAPPATEKVEEKETKAEE